MDEAAAASGRWPVRILIAAGTLLAVLAILAVWIERQALDTNEWVDTSSKVLKDEDVQVALSNYLAQQLFTKVDLQAELASRLPPRSQPLAAPIAGAAESAAPSAIQRLLDAPKVQELWKSINRTAHEQLLKAINDEGEFVSTGSGEVTLELKPLIDEATASLGIGADLAAKLPPDAGSLVILKSDEIETAQDIAKAMKGLAIILSILALGSFGLAIYLARGRRQSAVLWSGIGLILAGVLVLVVRSVSGDAVVDALVKNDSAQAAGDSTWSIGTSLLVSIATTVIVYGALFVVASWLASDTGGARWVRRAIAPTLRDRPALVYGLLAAAALIYFCLAPTHGLRAVLTILLLTGLAAFGIAALRRQTAAEFPAQPGT